MVANRQTGDIPGLRFEVLGISLLLLVTSSCGGQNLPQLQSDGGDPADYLQRDACASCEIAVVFADSSHTGTDNATDAAQMTDLAVDAVAVTDSRLDAPAASDDATIPGGLDAGVPCDPNTCEGCCTQDGECVEVLTDRQCAPPGQICAPCEGERQCDLTSGNCVLEQGERYLVTILSAEVDANCDTFDGCDLYAVVSLGGFEAETDWIEDDSTPHWNWPCFTVSSRQLRSNVLQVQILDDDDLSSDDPIGICRFEIDPSTLEGDVFASGPCDDQIDNIRLQFSP
jgi:hypothetical protein